MLSLLLRSVLDDDPDQTDKQRQPCTTFTLGSPKHAFIDVAASSQCHDDVELNDDCPHGRRGQWLTGSGQFLATSL